MSFPKDLFDQGINTLEVTAWKRFPDVAANPIVSVPSMVHFLVDLLSMRERWVFPPGT